MPVQMEIVTNNRTPVILVAGLDRDAVIRVGESFVVAGTTLIHHDLRSVRSGAVTRTVVSVDPDGNELRTDELIRLEHGCASCTLRLDLLPLLRRLHRRRGVEQIVIALDCSLEPEALAWAIEHVIVADMPGYLDGPAGLDVAISATVTCVAEMDWLEAATGDVTLAESGVLDKPDHGTSVPESEMIDDSEVDDDRTLAQVAVGQVAFADALVVAAADPALRDNWESARLMAVLTRLAPGAPIVMELPQRPVTALHAARLLAAIGPGARRGRVDDPHGSLLRGEPPLTPECGVQIVEFTADRPFHPERLHDALDVLLDGVVCARGRVWLATRGEEMFWLESAGGALRVSIAGRWLAATPVAELDEVDTERRAMAALRWDDVHGDRHTSIVVLVHRADPANVAEVLRRACLDDAEMADGPTGWAGYPDPFGVFHEDPCDPDTERADSHEAAATREDPR